MSKTIAPLKASLDEAIEKKDGALKELNEAKAKVADCEANVEQQNKTLAQYQASLAEVEKEANALNEKMDLASRLVNGLSGENKRWGENVVTLNENLIYLIGDVVLAASFVS